MFELEIVSSSGEILNLSQDRRFTLLEASGLDAPAAMLSFSKICGGDGSRYTSGYVEKRNIVLTLALNSPIEKNRTSLNSYFVINSLIRLRYKSDMLNVFTDGYVESCSCNAFEQGQKAVISILCENPYWTESVSAEKEFSTVTNMFEFPFSISGEGTVMSEITENESIIIDPGTAKSGFIIHISIINGVIAEPKIFNLTTGEFFGLQREFYEGDLIEINTVTGAKKVTLTRDGVKSSLLGRMLTGSSWVQLVPVKNEISYSYGDASGGGKMRVKLYYQRLYQGV